MNSKRVNEIIKNKEIRDVYYNDKPVWVQEIYKNKAKVGFMDGSKEQDVYIEELYEDNLYNK